jgi:hypothetical protein
MDRAFAIGAAVNLAFVVAELNSIATDLRQRFRIGHATIHIETEMGAAMCRLRPPGVI